MEPIINAMKSMLNMFEKIRNMNLFLETENVSISYTDGCTIFLVKENHPLFDGKNKIYRFMEFESLLATLLFDSCFYHFIRFREEKEQKEARDLAGICYMIMENHRIETCWNDLFCTPFVELFREIYYPVLVDTTNELSMIDIILDVIARKFRRKDNLYVKHWKAIYKIFSIVESNCYVTSTMRGVKELYDYIIKHGVIVGGSSKIEDNYINDIFDLYKFSYPDYKINERTVLSDEDIKRIKDIKQRFANTKYFNHSYVYILDSRNIEKLKITDLNDEVKSDSRRKELLASLPNMIAFSTSVYGKFIEIK